MKAVNAHRSAALVTIMLMAGLSAFGQWIPTGYGAFDGDVTSVVYHNSKVLAGTRHDGVFISSDNGASWRASNRGLSQPMVTALLSSGTRIIAGTVNSAFYSDDGGATWHLTGMPTRYVYSLLAHGPTLFAGTDSGIYLSSDNGMTWVEANTGLQPFTTVNAFAVSGSTIFAGTGEGEVITSTDNGGSWVLKLTTPFVMALGVHGSTILAATNVGLYRSTDTGTTWSLDTSMPIVLSFITVGSNFVAGTSFDVYISNDDGLTWTPSGMDHSMSNVGSMTMGAGYLFAGSWNGGVIRSDDDGVTWSFMNNGLAEPGPSSLIVDGSNVYGSTFYPYRVSGDYGATWVSKDSPIEQGNLVMTINSSTVFIGTYDDGVFVSHNNGDTWIPSTTGLTSTAIRCFANVGGNTLVGTANGVFITTDNGASWNATGLTSGVVDIASSGNLVYAAISRSIFKSSDGGITWQTLALLGSGNYATVIEIMNGVPYVGTEFGLFSTTDDGASWYRVGTSIINGRIRALDSEGSNLFVSSQNGVFMCASASIIDLNSGLPGVTLVPTLTAHNDTLYATVYGPGLTYGTVRKLPTGGSPGVSSVSPSSGIVGSLVTIDGVNFSSNPADHVVQFNDQFSTVISASPTRLVVSVPSTYGNAKIKMKLDGNTINAIADFQIIPVITEVTPSWGYVGTAVTVRGTGFTPYPAGVSSVKFNGVSASVYSTTPTSFVTYVPPAATTGEVSYVGSMTVGSSINFRVLPLITSFSPTSGETGTVVDIHGSGFRPGPADNAVTINGIPAVVYTVFATQTIRVAIPPGAQSGPFQISVSGNTAWSPTSFVVLPLASECFELPPKPTIDLQVDGPYQILLSSSNVGNQWYRNGTAISSARDSLLVVSEEGAYTVLVNILGCPSPMSDEMIVLVTGLDRELNTEGLPVSPNPTNRYVTIDFSSFVEGEDILISFHDMMGRRVFDRHSKGQRSMVIDLVDLPDGAYAVHIQGLEKTVVSRLIKRE
ncbi:MAG: IPT/TIG domain-containing protein [Cyclobacteriaceae bacterium]|nr:IPT/TIG domain-containing protein [Cyclobacteriaceae bacterium]